VKGRERRRRGGGVSLCFEWRGMHINTIKRKEAQVVEHDMIVCSGSA
jgi:hypothetical protein